MAAFKEPKKFGVIPGNAADVTAIQDAASVLNPSMTDLFPAVYQLALAAGGKAPERTTFNQFFKLYGEALYFLQRGGVWSYDATADYPAGAVVGYSGSLYLALGDNGPGTGTGAVTPGKNTSVWQKLVLESGNVASANIATKADSATRATSADRASAADCVRTDYNEIRFDWDSQVPGYVGLRVDTTDMGGIVTTNRLVSDIRAQWYAAYPDGAEAHNAMWGGRDITAAFDSGEFSEHVADGSFTDIFPGDYITKQVTISGTAYTVNWVIADCDYRLGQGDTETTAHHVVIVPETSIFNSKMNSDNTTENSYNGSYMHKTVIPTVATGLKNAFGDHIITFRDIIPTYCTNVASRHFLGWTGGSAPYGDWVTETCNLMNELMVYGCQVYGQSGVDVTFGFRQLSAFRLSTKLINPNRTDWWLRDVVSSTGFAAVHGAGIAGTYDASGVLGVRPFALLV